MTSAATQSPLSPAALRVQAGEILALDGWSRERLVAFQQSRLRAVLAHAVERSPYYRETLGPDAPERPLAELPTLSKPVLMEHFDRIVTDPALGLDELEAFLADAEPGASYRDAYRVFATSGATGIPGLFVFSHEEFAHWIAVGLAALARAGVTPETRLIAIGAPSDVHITRQLFAAFQAGRQGVPRLSVTTPIAEMVEALNAYQPEALIAYASIVGALADEQLEGRLHIEPDLITTTSEVLTDEIEERIEEAWGTPPVNAYAATEAPGIAIGSFDHVGMHIFEGSVVIEVVDESGDPVAPGVPGAKVLLTSLVNRAQPLIRYELTDAIVLAEGPIRAAGRTCGSPASTGGVATSSGFRRRPAGRSQSIRTDCARRSRPCSTSASIRSSASRTVCGCGSSPGSPRRPICPTVSDKPSHTSSRRQVPRRHRSASSRSTSSSGIPATRPS